MQPVLSASKGRNFPLTFSLLAAQIIAVCCLTNDACAQEDEVNVGKGVDSSSGAEVIDPKSAEGIRNPKNFMQIPLAKDQHLYGRYLEIAESSVNQEHDRKAVSQNVLERSIIRALEKIKVGDYTLNHTCYQIALAHHLSGDHAPPVGPELEQAIADVINPDAIDRLDILERGLITYLIENLWRHETPAVDSQESDSSKDVDIVSIRRKLEVAIDRTMQKIDDNDPRSIFDCKEINQIYSQWGKHLPPFSMGLKRALIEELGPSKEGANLDDLAFGLLGLKLDLSMKFGDSMSEKAKRLFTLQAEADRKRER